MVCYVSFGRMDIASASHSPLNYDCLLHRNILHAIHSSHELVLHNVLSPFVQAVPATSLAPAAPLPSLTPAPQSGYPSVPIMSPVSPSIQGLVSPSQIPAAQVPVSPAAAAAASPAAPVMAPASPQSTPASPQVPPIVASAGSQVQVAALYTPGKLRGNSQT
jgi:hypothetical protein